MTNHMQSEQLEAAVNVVKAYVPMKEAMKEADLRGKEYKEQCEALIHSVLGSGTDGVFIVLMGSSTYTIKSPLSFGTNEQTTIEKRSHKQFIDANSNARIPQ